MTKKQKRILKLTHLVWKDNGWTTYAEIGDVVYGTRGGVQQSATPCGTTDASRARNALSNREGASLPTCVELQVVLRRPPAV